MRHALAEAGAEYDAVAIVQVTSPFTRPADIDGTIRLLDDESADSAASVVEVPHDLHPFKFKARDAAGFLTPLLQDEGGRMAAHELPRAYVRNGSVYVSRLATIGTGRIIGDRCLGYLMPRERSLDLNDGFDWRIAEFLLQQQQQ